MKELIEYRNPNCTACPLHEGVKNVCVFGEGSRTAELFLVGEAPGEEEDYANRPFVGRSGKLLRNILSEYKLSEREVYISNSVKCRPPNNRRPHIREVRSCHHYLMKEISYIKPKLIVALGQLAAGVLLDTVKITVTGSRNKCLASPLPALKGIPIIVTYHPSAVIRDNTLIEAVFRDFEFIMKVLKQGAPDRKPCEYRLGVVGPANKEVSIDLETEGLNPFNLESKILCVGTSVRSRTGFCTKDIEMSREIVENPKILKVGHNIKFDMEFLMVRGFDFKGPIYDTMVAEHLINENQPSLGLKELAAQYTDMGAYSTKMEQLIKEYKGDMGKLFAERSKAVMNYCAQDVDAAWRLRRRQLPILQEQGLMPLCQLVMAGERMIARAEVHGIKIHKKRRLLLKRKFKKNIIKYKQAIKDICGTNLENPDSSVQLGKVLTGKLGLPVLHRTKSGKVSVDERTLKELRKYDRSGVVQLILKYRKLRGDYAKYLSRIIWQSDGKVHCNIRICGTDTGRYSCTSPNLQAVTRDSPIKTLFKSSYPGGKIISFDYDQGELRLLAHSSQDKKLLKAFKEGLDVHRLTASLLFKVSYFDVTEKQRYVGKTVNFGTMYGMGPDKLAGETGISINQARRFLQEFRESYPGVKQLIRDRGNEILERGYVTSLFNRRRRINILDESDKKEVGRAERQAFNAPIQGGLHDLNILSAVRLATALRNYQATIILAVHDQILIDSPPNEIRSVLKIAKEIFEHPDTSQFGFELSVPMPVSAKVGRTWGELKDVKI